MEAWLHAVGWRERLHVAAMRDASGALVALAPLKIGARGALDSGGRVVCFLGSDGPAGGTYLDLIAKPGWEGRAHLELMRHLAGIRREWSYICLNRVAVDDAAFGHWMAAALDQDLHATVDLRRRTVWAPLPSSWTDYINAVPNKRWRQRMRNLPAGLMKELPAARWIDRAGEDSLDGLLSDFRRLQEMRWEGEGGSYYRRPGFDLYMARLCGNMRAAGRLRAWSLMVDGRPASIRLGLVHRGSWLDFQTGWDPEFARHEISHITLWHCIEQAIGEGLQRMDSLDEYDYKKRYFRETRWVADLRIYDERIASALRIGWRAGRRAARSRLRSLLASRLLRRPGK